MVLLEQKYVVTYNLLGWFELAASKFEFVRKCILLIALELFALTFLFIYHKIYGFHDLLNVKVNNVRLPPGV